jgi:hypothetical protein
MSRTLLVMTAACGCLMAFGCSDSNTPAENPPAATAQNAPAEALPAEASPANSGGELASNQGVVVGHLSVAGYSYIEVENGGQRFWIATNPLKVTEGEVIGWGQAALMTDFYSKSLDRTFDQILFVGQVFGPAVESGGQAQSNKGKVLSVQNAAGYSYLEIEADSGALLWVAVPEVPIEENAHITWQNGSVMRNFTSNSLNQTFEEIIFSTGVSVDN